MLTIDEVATIAFDWLKDLDKATIITAIDMAESGGKEDARGDAVIHDLMSYKDFACQGYLSFGLGQVFLGVHTDMIQSMSGLSSPCQLADWLCDPNNNMRAQAAILANSTYNAWSVYKNGSYRQFLADATLAVERAALAAGVDPNEGTSPIPRHRPSQLQGRLFDEAGQPFDVAILLTPAQ